jgi:hypothetical protein
VGLFALTNISGARILRFPLTNDLDAEIKSAFSSQLEAFLNGIEEYIPFDGRYRPEEGELLVIDNYEDVEGLANAVANPMGVDQFDPNVHSLESIKALFSSVNHEGTEKILVQLFERRRLFATKGIAIFYSGNTFARLNEAGLTLDNKLLAVIDGKQLKFQSFHFLTRVFDLSEYFNEATAEEVRTFASHDALKVEDVGRFVNSANGRARKKIALILQSGILDKFTPAQIIATAQTFKVVINTTEDGKIVLPEGGVELQRILRFLEEDYYESPLTQTHFVSNSKRVAD